MEMNFLHYTATHSWSSPALFIDPEQTQRKLTLPYRRMGSDLDELKELPINELADDLIVHFN